MASLQTKQVRLEQLIPLIRASLEAGKNVVFSPRGTSMLPMLREGLDQVTLSPLPEALQKYDLPLYRRDNGQYVLHRIVKAGETFTCCGDNQYRVEEGLRRDQMIALVTAFTHRGRNIPVTHPMYRLYCRYWCLSRPWRSLLFRARRRLSGLRRK